MFAPIPTPFDPKTLEVRHDWLANFLRHLAKSQLDGIVIGGSNGEFALQTLEERKEVFATTMEVVGNTKSLVAGTGAAGYIETLELTNYAHSLGFNIAMVITPYYYTIRLTDDALIEYYTKLADNTKIPILLYTIPRFTGVEISPEVVATLSAHPNIIGIKDSTGSLDTCKAYVEASKGQNFSVMGGSGSLLQDYMQAGARGGILGIANLYPQECKHLELTTKSVESSIVQDHLAKIDNLVGKIGFAGLKETITNMGFEMGVVRPPLMASKKSYRSEFAKLFNQPFPVHAFTDELSMNK